MAAVVSEFFQITGVDVVPPETMSELIPYLLQIVVAVALVSATFAVIGKLAEVILNWRRW